MPARTLQNDSEATHSAADSATGVTASFHRERADWADRSIPLMIEYEEDDHTNTNASPSRGSNCDNADDTTTAPRPLTYWNGVALMIGLQIGSGIFSTPATVLTLIPSQPWAVAVWASAGLLVWTGAASFAELGSLYPNNGGMLHYLRHCFGSAPGEAGDVAGFLFAWVWIAVVKPCAMSMIAMIFAEYFLRGFAPRGAMTASEGRETDEWEVKGVALFALVLVTWLNSVSGAKAVGTANIFLILKLIISGTIIVSGFLWMTGILLTQGDQGGKGTRLSSLTFRESRRDLISDFEQQPILHNSAMNASDALLAALFAFGGWESVGLFAGDIANPGEMIPRILNSAMAIVITVFVLIVSAFYAIIPIETLQKTNAVAVVPLPFSNSSTPEYSSC